MKSGSLSVVICTFNRAKLLDRLLQSLAKQESAPAFEVVVVDNQSTDNTHTVLAEWKTNRVFRFVAASEPVQGHYARARNVGFATATGEIVAFIDDDVHVPPQWAAKLLHTFQTVDGIDGLGGPVIPEWEISPPDWITPELYVCIGVGNYGNEARFLKKREYPIGANMAFRSEMLRAVGGFDPRFGRIGKESVYNDEVELVDRIRQKGGKIYYDPQLDVYHLVSAARMNKTYFLNRRSIDGHSIALAESLHKGRLFLLRNVFLRAALAIVRDGTAFVTTSMIRANTRFVYLCRLAKTRKFISTALRILAGHPAFLEN